MDNDVLLAKLENLRHCLQRIHDKTPATAAELAKNADLQDIIVLNLERAIQNCVDIALHVISRSEMTVPDTMAKTFQTLKQLGCIGEQTADNLSKAVGFRNIAVHAYQNIDWQIVYDIITVRLDDFKDFARQIMKDRA